MLSLKFLTKGSARKMLESTPANVRSEFDAKYPDKRITRTKVLIFVMEQIRKLPKVADLTDRRVLPTDLIECLHLLDVSYLQELARFLGLSGEVLEIDDSDDLARVIRLVMVERGRTYGGDSSNLTTLVLQPSGDVKDDGSVPGDVTP